MADLADCENGLLGLALAALYPAGVPAPNFVSPVANALVDLRRGWPTPNELDAALARGIVMVRVYSDQGMTRNTTRFMYNWVPLQPVPLTLTGTVSGTTVTLAGSVQNGTVAGIAYGPLLGTSMAVQAFTAADTPATVAAALAASLPGSSVSGSTVTLPTSARLVFRAMLPVPEWIETRRQDQGFRISCWCNNPTTRDQVAAAIDASIAGMRDANGNFFQFFELPDGSSGWIRHRADFEIDGAEKAGLLRRDVCVMMEYPTSLIEAHPTALFQANEFQVVLPLDPPAPVVIPPGDPQPPPEPPVTAARATQIIVNL